MDCNFDSDVVRMRFDPKPVSRDLEIIDIDIKDDLLPVNAHDASQADHEGAQIASCCLSFPSQQIPSICEHVIASCRPLDTPFSSEVIYSKTMDDHGSVDPRKFYNEPLGHEHGVELEDDAATESANVVVHKKRISAAQRKAATKLEKSKRGAERTANELQNEKLNAIRGYESFYRLTSGSATLAQVVNSSAGIVGWSHYAKCLDDVSRDVVDDGKTAEAC